MGIEIKEVSTKENLWKWVRFPNKLYKDNEFFVPFLENDEFETFSKDKNPAYAFCETRLFLAYKKGKVVGRIAGLINYAYNKKWNKNAIRFTRFDFINDVDVSQALFDAVVSWGKEKKCTEIMDPSVLPIWITKVCWLKVSMSLICPSPSIITHTILHIWNALV